jgi:hypothetical protein
MNIINNILFSMKKKEVLVYYNILHFIMVPYAYMKISHLLLGTCSLMQLSHWPKKRFPACRIWSGCWSKCLSIPINNSFRFCCFCFGHHFSAAMFLLLLIICAIFSRLDSNRLTQLFENTFTPTPLVSYLFVYCYLFACLLLFCCIK